MAAPGLRRWLSRLKYRSTRPPASAEEQRLKRWRYRPVMEQLEERSTIGSLLVRPIVPDGYWIFDRVDTPALTADQTQPSTRAAVSQVGSAADASVVPQASSFGASAPSTNLPISSTEEGGPAPFTVDASADLSHTPLDINVLAALDNVFPAAPQSRGGGGAALPGSQTCFRSNTPTV